MNIQRDDLTGPEIHQLLQQHLQGMALHSPPESIHALDIDALRQPGITFWTAWEDDALLGCGALKELDSRHAEIKSMRTASAHLRQGVAHAMLTRITEQAKQRGYRRLSLETGSAERSSRRAVCMRHLASGSASRLRITCWTLTAFSCHAKSNSVSKSSAHFVGFASRTSVLSPSSPSRSQMI